MNELLSVAKLGRVVGLKGALKLHNLSDFKEQFKKGACFLACFDGAFSKTDDASLKELCIKSFDSKTNLVIFEGYESKELAANLVNITLKRSLDDTRKYCKLKNGEFFYFDILGCALSQDSQILGIVDDIMQTGAGFLFLLKTDESLINQGLAKEFYIPYNDHFIIKIDIKNKQITAKNSLEILQNS